ncbi:hypothetical protein RHGRI_007401 [Rhododendron griersonianum]|uniref:UMP kinase n=1 Tax=Rhododendron griersonianum TaxID=479676 RepID=A0AAV6KXF7_9ERIC|nr:hypothetical protein RHGRI_007401 [Rhododendron griersonianum]
MTSRTDDDVSRIAAFYSHPTGGRSGGVEDSSDPTKPNHATPNGKRTSKRIKHASVAAAATVESPGSCIGENRRDREEWSDSAIDSLLEAYTGKYTQLNRGNLRGRDWDEVAEIVSERSGDKQKLRKSVEQCKNKIDNLKKRYKVELQRVNSGGLAASNWHWFKKIEPIVGNSGSVKSSGDDEDNSRSGGGNSGYMLRQPKRSGGGNSGYMIRQPKRYITCLMQHSLDVNGVIESSCCIFGEMLWCTLYPSNSVALVNNMKSKSTPSPKWRRVVFKISGTALAGNCQSIDPKVASQIAREISTACRLGVEVAIVVGGRNFFCGDSWVSSTGLDRPSAYQVGMMATVMNSVLLQSEFEKLGVQTRVQSAFPMPEVAEPYCRLRAIRHLEKGRVVIFGGIGGGTGNPLFTTDTAAALRASEINADAVLKGTNVSGIYDHISFREVVSRGVTSMDVMAIQYCEENGISVVVFNLLEPGNTSRALCGEPVGTLIDQTGAIS